MKSTIKNIKQGWALQTGDLDNYGFDPRKYVKVPQTSELLECGVALTGETLVLSFRNLVSSTFDLATSFRIMKNTSYIYSAIKDKGIITLEYFWGVAAILKEELLNIPEVSITVEQVDGLVDAVYLSSRFEEE